MRGRPNTSAEIWRLITVGSPKDCWPYRGHITVWGYGHFKIGGIPRRAHRIVFELENGPIPRKAMVMHKCNNKRCCNPDHLTLGNNSRNQHHASASGARPLGASGVRGVARHKGGGWRAYGYHNGQYEHLYYGPDKPTAIRERKAWEAKHNVTFDI